jgi:hypothetical protein
MSYLNTDPYGRTQSSPQPYPPSRQSFGSDYTAHDPYGQQGSNDYFPRQASQSGYGTPSGNVDQHEMSTRPYSSTSHLVSNAQPEPQVYPQPIPIQSPVSYPPGGPSGVAVGQYLDPAQTGYVGNTPTYPPPSPGMYPPHQAAPMTPGFSANPYDRVMSPMGSNWNGGGQRWLETRDRLMRHRVRGGLTAEATRPTPAQLITIRLLSHSRSGKSNCKKEIWSSTFRSHHMLSRLAISQLEPEQLANPTRR